MSTLQRIAIFATVIHFLQPMSALADEAIRNGSLPERCRIRFLSGGWESYVLDLHRNPHFDDETIHATKADIIACPQISVKFCSAHKCIRTTLHETTIDLKKHDVMAISEVSSYSDNCTVGCTLQPIPPGALEAKVKEIKAKLDQAIKDAKKSQ